MGAEVKVYNSQALGKTTDAFDAVVEKRLQDTFTLNFSVVNNNPFRQYLVPGNVLEADGQKFDISLIKMSSGSANKTDVSGNHVGYRLSNYTIPIGYAFVGTITEIVADILDVSGADAEFSVGTCANLGTVSFSLGNEQETTARYALFAMKNIGVEVYIDNFTVSAPLTWGTGETKTFEFGVDMCDFNRTWDNSNGWSYDILIVDLQRIGGHEGDVFDTGDNITIHDKYIGDTIERRIISYSKCLDDPAQDKITLGVFVRNMSDTQIETDGTLNSTVIQGEQYSNVSINHTYGFIAVNSSNDLRVVQNADNCFAVQTSSDGGDTWETIQELTSEGIGATKLYNITSDVNPSYVVVDDALDSGRMQALSVYSNNGSEEYLVFSVFGDSSGTKISNNSDAEIRFSNVSAQFVNGLSYIGLSNLDSNPIVSAYVKGISGNPDTYLSLQNDGKILIGADNTYILLYDGFVGIYVNGVLKESWT